MAGEERSGLGPKDFGIGRLFWDIQEAIVVGDAGTEEIVLWNPAATLVFGYLPDEAIGMPLHRLVPERLRDDHLRGIAAYRATGHGALVGATKPAELPALRKDGSEISIELSLNSVGDPTGTGTPYVLAVIRDISERERIAKERALRHEVEARHRQAIEINDGVVQDLVGAKMALELGETATAIDLVERSLTRVRSMVTRSMSDGEAPNGA
ncbi:MAG TPA: PAS domain S-box protein [Actinomycetota bacterium]|nr:PAS domain S-box protein [Actinomycetota bacterium]